ncbi:hypothetical protein Tco_0634119 [Tanacetum coccineum]
MDKGFLDRISNGSKEVNKGLLEKGSLLGNIAAKVKNIDGKILGRDGKPMVARRGVRFSETTKESACGDGHDVIVDSSKVEHSPQAVAKCAVHDDGTRPVHGRNDTRVNDLDSHTNDAPVEHVISSDVCLPMEAIDEIKARVCPIKRVAGPSKLSDMQADEKKDKQLVQATGKKGKGKQVGNQRYIKGYCVNIPKSKLVYSAVVKPQGDKNVASNMGQSLDTTKKPSPSDSSMNGKNSSMEILNEDLDTDVDEFFVPKVRTTFPSSSGGGGHQLEEDAYDDYEDQFEDYPSLHQEFCDQFDFKVKGLGRK